MKKIVLQILTVFLVLGTGVTSEGFSEAETETEFSYPEDTAGFPADWKDPVADIVDGSTLPSGKIITDANLPSTYVLDMDNLLQKPELPTGCESVALTIALNALGYSLPKTEIADKYLYYSDYSIVTGYVGNPFSVHGAGIYPPGLVRTANRFLTENKSDYTAYDATGFELEDLFRFIAAGHPVVIWGTMYFEEPMKSDEVYEYAGKTYRWYWNEHCMALQGYDLTRNILIIQDPLQGKVEIDTDQFRDIYNDTGMMAMTIY